jgi:hypothetical protein
VQDFSGQLKTGVEVCAPRTVTGQDFYSMKC